MREIKFRAWDKSINSIMDVYSIEYLVGGVKVEGTGVHLGNGWATVNKECKEMENVEPEVILMQYTGLKANGVDIYEGDICRVEYYVSKIESKPLGFLNIVQVKKEDEEIPHDKWKTSSHKEILEIKSLKQIYRYINALERVWEDRKIDSNIFEVIGNIYENPELLKNNE